jgi:hypothetical protein
MVVLVRLLRLSGKKVLFDDEIMKRKGEKEEEKIKQ